MPAPLDTEDELRLWLQYRLDRSFAFKLWRSTDGRVCGEIREQAGPGRSWFATGCRSISECVKQLWALSLI